MPTLSRHTAIVLATVLSVAMWITRGQHVATLTHLPDASWAVFFLLGVYFRSRSLLPLFLAQAGLADYLAVTQFGAGDFCVTPAYPFLLPAYSALWLAGRWYAGQYRHQARTLAVGALSAVAGAAVCELISSGSFYFLGGRFADTSLSEFARRLALYFPGDLANALLYLGLAAAVHVLLSARQRHTTAD